MHSRLFTVLFSALFFAFWCADVNAQCRVEGTVRWSDGRPAAGTLVAIADFKLTTTTDSDGRYAFEAVRAGIRATITVFMNNRYLASAYSLISLKVEQIDILIPTTMAQHQQAVAAIDAGASAAGRPRSETSGPVGDGGRTDIVTFTDDGIPIVSSKVTVAATVPMLSTSTEAGKVTLEPDQVAALPSLGTRDIFRALQWLPGIASNETSSGLFVRGGTPDQNLVDYDGFTVYTVDHLFGYFSAFNMDAIDSVDVSKGAYEARFGGRLSSVTEVRGKSRSARPQGSVGASLLSADGVFQMPIGSSTSFLAAYRRSYQSPLYDRILGLVGRQRAPSPARAGRFATLFSSQPRSSFDDMNGRFDFRPSDRDQLAVTAYLGNDDVDNSRNLQLPAQVLERLAARGLTPNGGITVTDIRDIRNTGLSAHWDRTWGAKVATTFTFGRSDFDTLTQRSSNVGGGRGGNGELNVVDDTTVKIDAPISITPSHTLTLGAQRTVNRVAYQFASSFARPATDATSAPPPALTSQLNRTTTSDLTSLYVQHRLLFGTRVMATPGIRMSRFSLTRLWYPEPRLATTVVVTDRIRLKAAWGRYHQFVNRLVREDVLQGNREFWSLSDGSVVPVAASTNMAAGATYETSRLLIDGEVFARRLSNLSQLAPRLTGSSEGVDLSQFFYQGNGTVKGVELLAQRKVGRHTGWVGYTRSRIVYDFPELGAPFLADHDRTHELKFVDVFQLNRWTFSGTWILSTGRPYTEPVGTETLTRQGPLGEINFERIVVGDKNGVRLPAYHRLDLAANYSWRFGDGHSATLALSAFNAYNRANLWYKEFTGVDGEIVENDVALMPRTLNVNLSIRF